MASLKVYQFQHGFAAGVRRLFAVCGDVQGDEFDSGNSWLKSRRLEERPQAFHFAQDDKSFWGAA
jgi:hypothetical protein